MLSMLRNAGAVRKKRIAIATAPMKAPTAGMPRRVDRNDRVCTRSSPPTTGGVVVAVLMTCYRVPLAAKPATASTLVLSMNAGPVATFWPPPRVLPFVL